VSALPLILVGGSPALDLVNTVNWTERGLERERLASYEDLVRWSELAGAITPEAARRIRAAAGRNPRGARLALARAHAVRDTLQRLFAAVANGRSPDPEALRQFNTMLAQAQGRLFVDQGPRTTGEPAFAWRWRGMGEDPSAMLWPVLCSAAELLTSTEAARVRMCAGQDCGWMYVDRSRNGLRRWCEMRTCGNVAKARRHYQRVRSERESGGR
jgi:predicted RNA-binding Zn ribbon-like protein